jgi:hypothetical protein
MGVPEIWPHLENSSEVISVPSRLAGECLAVDGMIWVVKATIKYHITYIDGEYGSTILEVRGRAAWWVSRGVRPKLVFDGGNLAGKARAHMQREGG